MADEVTTPAAGVDAPVAPPVSEPAAPSGQPVTERAPPSEQPVSEPAEDQGKATNKHVNSEERVKQALSRQRLAERERDNALRRLDGLQKTIRPQNFEQLDYEARDQLRVREAVRQETAESVREEALRAEGERREAWADARDARNESFVEKLTSVEAQNPGLFDRFAAMTVTEDMAEFIGGSRSGIEMVKHLSAPENRREAEHLVRLTDPRSATREDLREADRIMSRIEQRVAASSARRVTTAPNPGTTLSGSSAAPAGRDPATMSDAQMSEWYKERKKAAQR